MGYHVSGIVAQAQALAGIAADRGPGTPIPLPHGLALLPLDEENVGGLAADAPDATPPASPLSFEHLTPAVLAALTDLSAGCRLAYTETDYHGGTGGQGAVVCDGGRVVVPPPRGDGPRSPVSRALAHLGVRVGPAHLDAFDGVGLNAFRSNDEWRRARAPR